MNETTSEDISVDVFNDTYDYQGNSFCEEVKFLRSFTLFGSIGSVAGTLVGLESLNFDPIYKVVMGGIVSGVGFLVYTMNQRSNRLTELDKNAQRALECSAEINEPLAQMPENLRTHTQRRKAILMSIALGLLPGAVGMNTLVPFVAHKTLQQAYTAARSRQAVVVEHK